jgi:Family of unknown function (DUF6544)
MGTTIAGDLERRLLRPAGLLAGADRYLHGAGALQWKLAGLVTVASGEGADISRSAAGRAGAEGVWLPTALLPRFGVRWSVPAGDAGNQVTAAFSVGETPVALDLRLDPAGRVVSLAFDRWATPTATASPGTGSGARSPAGPASAA